MESAFEDRLIEDLLTSIVEMIKQREHLALETSFAKSISRLTDARALTCYRLIKANKGPCVVPVLHFIDSELAPLEKPHSRSSPLSADPVLAERLSRPGLADMIHDMASHGSSLILPLRGTDGEVAIFFRVENPRIDANTKRVLALLLDFHHNLLTLLEDTERDNLTGLLNRKTLSAEVARIIRTLQTKHRRTSDKLTPGYSLAVFDIDHFKQVNDSFGHIYGDEVLLTFANMMKESFRENDQLFRYGGEEFVALLADIDTDQAKIVLDRFRAKVKNCNFPHVGQITTSVGVASIRSNESPAEATHRADMALYFAKRHGRNQVHAYEELVAQGLLTEQGLSDRSIKLH